LSGCQRLLVLLGSTYCSRLWCVMEMFVYVQMRGKSGDVRVAALEAEAFDKVQASFNADHAECYLVQDRERMKAVIEAGFGDLAPFNRVARRILLHNVVSKAWEPSPGISVPERRISREESSTFLSNEHDQALTHPSKVWLKLKSLTSSALPSLIHRPSSSSGTGSSHRVPSRSSAGSSRRVRWTDRSSATSGSCVNAANVQVELANCSAATVSDHR